MSRSVPIWSSDNHDAAIPRLVKARIFERQNGLCALSGRKLGVGAEWHFDHIIPLADGGRHADDFPSDRPAEPAFDVIAWAADFNRSLSSYSAVDAMREEWLAHKDDLKASSPALFKEVNAAVAARAAEIAGDK